MNKSLIWDLLLMLLFSCVAILAASGIMIAVAFFWACPDSTACDVVKAGLDMFIYE